MAWFKSERLRTVLLIVNRLIRILVKNICKIKIRIGISLDQADDNTLIFLPFAPNTLNCGITALVAFKSLSSEHNPDYLEAIKEAVKKVQQGRLYVGRNSEAVSDFNIERQFLGGENSLKEFFNLSQSLKQDQVFNELFFNQNKIEGLYSVAREIRTIIEQEKVDFKRIESDVSATNAAWISCRLEKLCDILWCIEKEVLENIDRIVNFYDNRQDDKMGQSLILFKRINTILNNIDRLEVRGRDSAGISMLFTLNKNEFENFIFRLKSTGLHNQLVERTNNLILSNNSITINEIHTTPDPNIVSIAFVYKLVAEIGALGDNTAFIRSQIRNDQILHILCTYPLESSSILAHTRWASVGDITEANCHPVDNKTKTGKIDTNGIIHVCLNGDIDNYLELKEDYETLYEEIPEDINTDTKIIPLQIEHYLRQGKDIETAFREAVNEFDGSHAISMHTDLAPGKLFLAQRGSGQAIFVGIASDYYIAASELYGIVEQTQSYIKLKGEEKGQIVILDQESFGGLAGIRSYYYNKESITIKPSDFLVSQITSRDIDRQEFLHYFLKEISESPKSVRKTLENKFQLIPESRMLQINLGQASIPEVLERELAEGKIRKIYFIGQGTAGVAAQGCANLLSYYLGSVNIEIRALKSSELSGLCITESEKSNQLMNQALVVAISQSGTTTDTNRTIDMIKARGARALGIVNRRDSDLTFKVDGVLYTSSGRDIEMSVASTKAFYAQITAGAILGLYFAAIMKRRTPEFITQEIKELLSIPEKMETVLAMQEQVKASAFNLATSRHSWATVGSGANKVSADEIRIKLSELCYKTISSDFVEDKKHIDLSSEPLIIVCAAGTRESVLRDIIKDAAIFSAHKATTVIITNKGEDRFDSYAKDIFKVPPIKEHFAPILNTLIGHIWGYYAALAINEGSSFLYIGLAKIQSILNELSRNGLNVYEILLEKRFREKIAKFYNEFSEKVRQKTFPSTMGLDIVSNITLVLKYLSGRLPISDFEVDFKIKGTPGNILDVFFKNMGQAIGSMSRPIDAIKHQAKTVTVGTSRIAQQFDGLVFYELKKHNIHISQITHKNVLVIKNLQEVIAAIKGSLLYRISGLNLLGEVTPQTRIYVIQKSGVLQSKTSRVESDSCLKGTKHIIVREGNVYIGKGRKDQRNILVIPIMSVSPEMPNIIEYILSLNISFKPTDQISLVKKIKALGGKYTRLKDWVLESKAIQWNDKVLNMIPVETLFGETAEKVVDAIINKLSQLELESKEHPLFFYPDKRLPDLSSSDIHRNQKKSCQEKSYEDSYRHGRRITL